jgi:predicted O-methyltransferase YrrM
VVSLSEYVERLYPSSDEFLQRMPGEAEEEGVPLIQIPDEIGRLLQILIKVSGVSTVLELGTLFGYSSIWMARALPESGRITTLEAEPRHASVARRNFEIAGIADKVDIKEGPALETLSTLAGTNFDLVFIDADKVNYVSYLEWALRLTRSGSVIVADNVWRGGAVVSGNPDDSARVMSDFNDRVARNPGLLSTMIATRDGADATTVAYVL